MKEIFFATFSQKSKIPLNIIVIIKHFIMEGYTREQRNKAAGRALGKMSKKMVEGKKLIKKNN